MWKCKPRQAVTDVCTQSHDSCIHPRCSIPTPPNNAVVRSSVFGLYPHGHLVVFHHRVTVSHSRETKTVSRTLQTGRDLFLRCSRVSRGCSSTRSCTMSTRFVARHCDWVNYSASCAAALQDRTLQIRWMFERGRSNNLSPPTS